MVSWVVAPSFSFANSLILVDVLSAARKHYKNIFSKVSFNLSCNKTRLETENIFLREKLSYFLGISRFVYKSTPVFQAKRNNISKSSCIS